MKNKFLLLLVLMGHGLAWAGPFTSTDEPFESVQQTALTILGAFLKGTEEGVQTAWNEMETVGKGDEIQFLEDRKAIGKIARTLTGEFTAIGTELERPGLLEGKQVTGFSTIVLAVADKGELLDQVMNSVGKDPVYQATLTVYMRDNPGAKAKGDGEAQELKMFLLFHEVGDKINLASIVLGNNDEWEIMTLIPQGR